MNQATEQEQAIQALVNQAGERDQSIESLKTQVAKRERAVKNLRALMAEITNAKAWKLALLIRKLRILIAPPNGYRTRAIRRLKNIFAGPAAQSGP